MKHFSDLSLIPLERLKEELRHWKDEAKNARTEQGKQNASEILEELLVEIESRKRSEVAEKK